ncbi:matrixin family metalloprotease [Nocardioides sp. zg-536]|uniref:Matrixin family metalloprotease n=1 Tax=Nocardioides faecalis TaxID=2803858 RepID=A0A938Y3W9_9ACTN|nr:matrixin family metalloprotease [Nocardioides faecalis]MBM9459528.1 matrixin family metalloprotease [Nocardioides faecalis]MBS4753692.1 matrixin family metalloprotease [Nocardioides faecalis]QVI58063.1 matrixin family metalloprotease [Nocardioides faecalis]
MAERWRSGMVLVLSAVLLVLVVWVGPGDELAALRRVIGIGGDRLGTPADVEPGGVHSFLQTQPGRPDEPVAWDPCRPVRYEINPDGGPGDAEESEDFVAEGLEAVAQFTGLRFEYVGRTDRRPEWAREFVPIGRREPVLISWATAEEVAELDGDVAGIGGAVAVSAPAGDWLRYVTGGVTLDADTFDDLDDERDGDAYARAILLHELGHLVGLGHVDSPAELMYDDNLGRLDFGTGDLNGLVRLGGGRCA